MVSVSFSIFLVHVIARYWGKVNYYSRDCKGPLLSDFGFRIQELGLRIQGLGFRIQWFRVLGFRADSFDVYSYVVRCSILKMGFWDHNIANYVTVLQ